MAHALILGASGISGWSLLNQTRTYPSPTTFARITGTTNRPLSLEKAQIPPDDRVLLVSGIDFTKSVDDVVELLKVKIPDVNTVTHVFFTAYIQVDDLEELRVINTRLLEVAIDAIERVAPKLQSVILQTGGKGYGMQFPKEVGIKAPLKETLPRIPEPYYSKIFYYTQYDKLKELSEGKPWTFTEIRPDGIIGFAPGWNAMNLSQGIGIYLSIFRAVHGPGAAVPFPGNERGYKCTHSDTFQDILSKMEIFAALNTDKCGNGEAFNVADGKTVRWSEVWPALASHFGLVGEGPKEGSAGIAEFVKQNGGKWLELANKHGLRPETAAQQNWAFVEFMLVDYDFDREYDLSHAREVGFSEEIDTAQGYIRSWERMRDAGILPPQ